MRRNTVAHLEKEPVSTRNRTKAILKWRVLVHFAALVVMLGLAGCDEYYGYYGAHPGYGPYYGSYGPYGHGYYGGGYGSYYGSYGPYGHGYYGGGAHYVWRPGHWAWRHGQQVWIRGHYVLVRT
jgi:hypothetical protein